MKNDYDDFEDWEVEAEMIDNGEWEKLVEYRRVQVKNHPDSPYDGWALGEALVLNKDYEEAISLLSALHKKHPDDPNTQHTLLDALIAVGKDENSVDWINKPVVIKLDKDILDCCYDYLQPKRKRITVDELYIDLICGEGYPMFSAEQFMRYLQSDNRFTFTGDLDRYYDCYIGVRRR